MNTCMTTGVHFDKDGQYPDDTIVIYRNGKIIGLVSPEAQDGVKTLRMTLTRDTRTANFQPLQGQCIETFHEHERSQHRDYADTY